MKAYSESYINQIRTYDLEYLGSPWPEQEVSIKGFPVELRKKRIGVVLSESNSYFFHDGQYSSEARGYQRSFYPQDLAVHVNAEFFLYFEKGDYSVGMDDICFPALKEIKFFDSEGNLCFQNLSRVLNHKQEDLPISIDMTVEDRQEMRRRYPKVGPILDTLFQHVFKCFQPDCNLNN